MTVGPTQNPPSRPGTTAFRPSTSTFAPACSASAMARSMRSFAWRVMTGPTSRPATMVRAWAARRSTMWSVADTATMTDAAMHRWPVQPLIAASTPPAAISGIGVGHHDHVVLGAAQREHRLSAAVPRR